MAVPPKITKLLEGMEEGIRQSILDAIADIRSRARLAALVSAIERGSVQDVLSILSLGDEFFEPVDEAIRAAYIQGGRDAILAASRGFPRSTRLGIIFSGRSPEAEAWIRERSSRLIVEIASSTREAVRGVLVNGLSEGRNPRSVALDLIGRVVSGRREGGVIGLNSQLVSYLESARRELESGDASLLRNYLTRELRDRRFDRTVLASIESGRRITSDQVSQMTSRYSDALLRFRATMIARTEATAALNSSRHEAVRQLVAAGHIDEGDVQRRWRSAGADGRTRDTHLEMDDQRVTGLQEPFVSSSGARMMHPGDTSLGAPAEEIINCRCYEEILIDYIAAQARRERASG